MRKKAIIVSVVGILLIILSGCAKNNTSISVISREEGSGTRSSFVEIMDITKDGWDNITPYAEVASTTAIIMTSVQTNRNAIGYISLGVFNDSVKKVSIDGIEPTATNIKNGTYPIARPFNIVTKSSLNKEVKDYIDFVLSKEGKMIVEEEGYIGIDTNYNYEKKDDLKGTVTIAGSTSVAPVIETLAEEYMKINEGVSIEIQQSGSSAGITSVIEGACEIGMASRDLKESELKEGLTETTIALDGICIIVNPENKIDSLSTMEVKEIFSGNITDWLKMRGFRDE